MPGTPLIEGHAAPFEYLRWAFFENVRFEHDESPPRREDIALPPDAVIWANRGGGKTFLGAVATMLDMVFKPGIEIRILAGSMDQSQRMHQHLRLFFERPELAGLIEGRITDKRLRLVNGSGVELLAQSQASVRGTRVQRLRCDEVELFDPEVWEAAQLTTKSRRCGGVWIRASIECLSTMHIPHGLMHRLVAEAREGKRRLFKWGVLDVLDRCGDAHTCESSAGKCPLWDECQGRAKSRSGNGGPLSLGYVEVHDAIQMKSRVSLPTWEAEMLCLRPRTDDAVLPEFDPKVHVVEQAPVVGVRWIGGMDFGYRSPTVVLWAAVDDLDRIFVMDERVRTKQTTAEHARAIVGAAWPELEWIGVDPAGLAVNEQTGESAVSVLRKAGLRVRTGRSAVAGGLELIRRRLRPASGQPRLFVHRRCTTLIESLEKYHYPKGNLECTEPEKDGPDHAVDALRYMVLNLERGEGTVAWNYSGE